MHWEVALLDRSCTDEHPWRLVRRFAPAGLTANRRCKACRSQHVTPFTGLWGDNSLHRREATAVDFRQNPEVCASGNLSLQKRIVS